MPTFKKFIADDIQPYLSTRNGEYNYGHYLKEQDFNPNAIFQIVFLPEDIGVRANYGKGGAQTTIPATLQALLNQPYVEGSIWSNVNLYGYIDFEDLYNETDTIDDLRVKVETIDLHVAELIEQIKQAGKTPIIIGGGHNNAYPIIKACATSLLKKMATINIDAHLDLRAIEGRHSGNGFSYAFENGFLEQYYNIGARLGGVNNIMLNKIADNLQYIKIYSYEDLIIKKLYKSKDILEFLNYSLNNPVGLELDIDVIANTLSSAMHPIGFSMEFVQNLVYTLSSNFEFEYFHITEAVYQREDGAQQENIGIVITQLIYVFLLGNRDL